tara:strand:- start:216 stop:791 length:576 start_codon:yes stop_codon:yes gene_type:complete
MKFIFIFIFLFKSTALLGQSVNDFQIEKMSVGDSLLEYFDKNEIDKFYKRSYPSSSKFLQVDIINIKLIQYDQITVAIKNGDDNFIIYEVKGFKRQKNINECLDRIEKTSYEIENLVNVSRYEYENTASQDETGESTYYASDFYLDDGSIRIFCYEWSEKMKKKGGYYDESFTVVIYNEEFKNFLNNEAYK